MGSIHVADVDAQVRAIEGAACKCLIPARDVEMAGRIAMVADPQGAPFYVMTPTPPPDRPDAESDVFSVDRPQHVRWNELTAPDDAAGLAFYAEQFGWAKVGAMPMGAMGDYTFVAHRGVTIGAFMRGSPPAWRYYIGVDDIDAAVAAIKDGGGTVLEGPHEIPGGEFSLHGRDPQGADFGLVGPRKG
jgi:predicted enzyme related to lactoylglutathione lyase